MRKKLENFLYYYKFHLVAVIFIIIIVVVLITDRPRDRKSTLMIVDHTSAMNMEKAENMMNGYEKSAGLEQGQTGFRYHSSYLEQDEVENINLQVAGVDDYYDCMKEGYIDLVLNDITGLKTVKENEEGETEEVYTKNYPVVSLDKVFTEEELKKYEPYVCYIEEKPVGIIFDECKKAQEFFGDDYPTGNHYVIQVTEGSAQKEEVKDFFRYLIGE